MIAFTLGVTLVNIREVVIVNVLTLNIFVSTKENLISSTSYPIALLLSLSFKVHCFILSKRMCQELSCIFLYRSYWFLKLSVVFLWIFCLKLTIKWYTLAGKTGVSKFFYCFEHLKKIRYWIKIFTVSDWFKPGLFHCIVLRLGGLAMKEF